MNPSFYVVYPADEIIKLLINAIRVIADERQRSQVHITVRGPYAKKLSKDKEDKYSSIIRGEKIHVIGIGSFFSDDQNTVYYKCTRNAKLKKIWMKTSYKDFNPHMTIYDGEDKDYAMKIYKVLRQNFVNFSFQIEELAWLEPKNRSKLELFNLKTVIDFNRVSSILNYNLTPEKVIELDKEERLQFISVLSSKLYH